MSIVSCTVHRDGVGLSLDVWITIRAHPEHSYPSSFECCLLLGVLHGGSDDFTSPDDVYEAIGDMLVEVTIGSSSPEDDIRSLCAQLFRLLHPEHVSKAESNGPATSSDGGKKSDGPVRLAVAGSLLNGAEGDGESEEDVSSIWLKKRPDMSKACCRFVIDERAASPLYHLRLSGIFSFSGRPK